MGGERRREKVEILQTRGSAHRFLNAVSLSSDVAVVMALH